MKLFLILSVSLYLSPGIIAGELNKGPPKTSAAKVHVQVDTKTYPLAEFSKLQGVEAQALDKSNEEDSVPDRAVREAAFARVKGLSKSVEKMDELDRDLLFMRARKAKSAWELRKKYPKISGIQLNTLVVEAKK